MEREVGIEVYLTRTKGILGKLKRVPEDFIAEEIPILPPKVEDGKYVAAIIRSRNWETNRLVRAFARSLHISRKRISFAGTKDKRAVTKQLFQFEAPLNLVRSLKLRDVDIVDAYRTDKRISIGDLLGNRFTVTIRDIGVSKGEAEEILEAIRGELLSLGGYPNFFGVQRFGVVRPVTHLVGKHMVRGNFKAAVETYVANPIKGEDESAFEARLQFQERGDVSEALRSYPKTLSFEKAMLNHLAKRPNDYIGALRQLPLNLLMMFVHAYQAFLFNRILSERIRRSLPLNRSLLGDIILPLDKMGLPDRERAILVTHENVEKIERRTLEGRAFVSGLIFGSQPLFAEDEMGEIERRAISQEGIEHENFIIPSIPELSSKGGRRELLAPLHELHYEMAPDGVTLKFQLTRGCYATSLLREIMKADAMSY